MLIETHAHMDYSDFEADLDNVLERARDAGVTRIVTIGTSVESSRRAVELAELHPMIHAVVGVHPTCVPEDDSDVVTALRELAKHPKVAAIGETGLDYHHLPGERRRKTSQPISALGAGNPFDIEAEILDDAFKARQARYFIDQLDLAAELGMNVVVHQRDAWTDTLELIAPYSGKLRGVFHCFGGSADDASTLFEMGHLVSFTGIVTFKNGSRVLETAASLPSDRFMVETDCPYLAPSPNRGQRCEPAHTRLVAEAIAEARGVPLEDVARSTTTTAESFFLFNKT